MNQDRSIAHRISNYLERRTRRAISKISSTARSIHRPVPQFSPNDYNAIHAYRAAQYLRVAGTKCLVVGCNTGKDCTYFVKMGASAVDGLDVIDDIGADFQHPRVRYFNISAEQMNSIKDNSYDLVYCFATMEHVPRIELAFPEFCRVAKPGGIIYSVAAPLWNSRNGHHKSDFFDDYPWIHLRLSVDEILQYCREKHIEDTVNNLPMEQHVQYMLNPTYFNMRPAHDYLDICNQLKGIQIRINEVVPDDPSYLTDSIQAELRSKGYTPEELLGVVHTFIAQKAEH